MKCNGRTVVPDTSLGRIVKRTYRDLGIKSSAWKKTLVLANKCKQDLVIK